MEVRLALTESEILEQNTSDFVTHFLARRLTEFPKYGGDGFTIFGGASANRMRSLAENKWYKGGPYIKEINEHPLTQHLYLKSFKWK